MILRGSGRLLSAVHRPKLRVVLTTLALASLGISARSASAFPHVLAEGETRTLTLSAGLEIRVNERRDGEGVSGAPQGSSALTKAGWAVLGVGVAGAVVAGVTGGMLMARDADIQRECPGKVCSPAGRDLVDGAGSLKVVNAIGWGVGIAGVGASVVMLVVGRTPAKRPPPVGALILPGGGGVSLEGSF